MTSRRERRRAAQSSQTNLMTFDEIVKDWIKRMGPGAEYSWLTVPKSALIGAHRTTGQTIRNQYHLWTPGHPAVGNEHPDDVSMKIMEAIWEALQVRHQMLQTIQEMPDSLQKSLASQ